MKKVLYLLTLLIGAGLIYYGISYFNNDKKVEKPKENETIKNETETVPSKDAFISEAIKLQTLAENKGDNETCRCYKVKELDVNSPLTGSILVYTIDDLFVSSMWLSNGYYILDGTENAATGLLEESSNQASQYCGEQDSTTEPSLCAVNY